MTYNEIQDAMTEIYDDARANKEHFGDRYAQGVTLGEWLKVLEVELISRNEERSELRRARGERN